jgi:hypothetical protein
MALRSLVLVTFCFIYGILNSQENKKGDIIIGFSIGPSFSNFVNSEAPHKLNIFGSDVSPVSFTSSDLTQHPAYADYSTGLFKDILTGVSAGFQLEYFLSDRFSLQSGLYVESKGIHLDYSKYSPDYGAPGRILDQTFQVKIHNYYLTLPVMLRTYFFSKRNIYVEMGLYAGYLFSSEVNYYNHKKISNDQGIVSDYSFRFDNFSDPEKKYTRTLDAGFSLGAGYIKRITDKWTINAGFRMNMGLLKVDSKYNNDYSVTIVPSGTNLNSYLVHATNYYGLNSYAKNINFILRVGVGYKIGK